MTFSWTMIYLNILFPVTIFAAEYLLTSGEKRKTGYRVKTILFILCYLMIAVFFNYQSAMRILSQNGIGIFVRYIFLWLFTAIWLKMCFTYEWNEITLILLCGYVVQHSAYSIEKLTYLFMKKIINWIVYTIEVQVFENIVVYILVYILLYQMFLSKIRKNKLVIKGYLIVVLAMGVLINVLILDMNTYGFSMTQRILFRLLSIFDCMLVLGVIDKISENYMLARDIEFIEQLSAMKVSYYDALKESILLTNMKCHDFKYQIRRIRKNQGEPDEVCKEIEKSIENYGAYARTGNENLDVILSEKNLICQNKEIQFTYMADGESLSFMSAKDIYSLFGNLLDNAIEAVEKIGNKEKRIIELQVRKREQLLNIQIDNYFDGILNLKEGFPETTKEKRNDHGYGMKSISYIVKKYNGEMLIKSEDHIFECSIIIPLKNIVK